MKKRCILMLFSIIFMLAVVPGMALAAESEGDSAALSDSSVIVINDELSSEEGAAVVDDDSSAVNGSESKSEAADKTTGSTTGSDTDTTNSATGIITAIEQKVGQEVEQKVEEIAGQVVSTVTGLVVKSNPDVDPTAVAGVVGNTVNSVITDVVQQFNDVRSGAWYEAAVKFVKENGLMNGITDNSFAPNEEMTRAMLMKVLATLKGVDVSGGATWYEKAMTWAIENGISDGSDVESNITREQLAVMLYRYAGSPEVEGDLSGFTDAADVQSYAQDAMIWAVQSGLITGNEDGTLNPGGNATRAEVAAILMRFCGK
jgi:hypothetical protein